MNHDVLMLITNDMNSNGARLYHGGWGLGVAVGWGGEGVRGGGWGGGGGGQKRWRAVNFFHPWIKYTFSMYGQDILCGISKGTIEIPQKCLTHKTLKDTIFIQRCNFKSSSMSELVSIFETLPRHPTLTCMYNVHICGVVTIHGTSRKNQQFL